MHGEAKDISKQKSKQIAAMKFIKTIYPGNYTWQMVLKEVSTKKKPLNGMLVDLYQVKQIQSLTVSEELENDTRRLKAIE